MDTACGLHFGMDTVCDACETPRGRAIRDELKKQNAALQQQVASLLAATGGVVPATGVTAAAAEESIAPADGADARAVITPGKYEADPYTGRGDYPRKNDLSVLADVEGEIRAYDADHVSWIIKQMGECDPDLGGEETLDKDLAPGVTTIKLAALIPEDQSQCGAMAVSQPGVTVGPTKVWMKMVNGAGGFGGLRGRGEWMVPEAMADDTCRILYLHGGSFMWYSGVDDIYRPLTSRIAAAAGMPVLVIDYRLSPEWTCTDTMEDALDALAWMGENGPNGPSKARKLFVCGDSSGGGSALAMLLAARDGIPGRREGAPPLPRIDGCSSICPLADLTYDFERSPLNSYRTRMFDEATFTGDPVFTDTSGNLRLDMEKLQEKSRLYCGHGPGEAFSADTAKNYLASPLWAEDWSRLPPILFLGADEDVTVDDAIDCANSAKEAGVEVDLAVWPRMFHCWVCYCEGRDNTGEVNSEGRSMEEACVAIRHIGLYFKRLSLRSG